MTRPVRLAVSAGVASVLLLAAGCARPAPDPQQQASAARKAACRQRADEVYTKQNRGEVYETDTYTTNTRDSPFATSGLPGITTRGLGGQYERDNMIRDCLNDAAGNVGNTPPEPPAPTTTGAAQTPGRLPRSLSPLAVPPSP